MLDELVENPVCRGILGPERGPYVYVRSRLFCPLTDTLLPHTPEDASLPGTYPPHTTLPPGGSELNVHVPRVDAYVFACVLQTL